jgi:uncharacterized surface protein with fasciclin (FAS1) repeats
MTIKTSSNLLKAFSIAGLIGATVLVSIPATAKSCNQSAKQTSSQQTNAAPALVATTPQAKTIVQIASTNGSFNTLTAALEAAGLVDTLSGKGPFTVFAPTDAAFAALPKGTVETLLKPENKDKLIKVLTYHVVPGQVLSTSLKAGKVKTVEGSDVAVRIGKSGVNINNAKVTTADIKASNGVIHVIDKVILPPDLMSK